MARKKKKNNNHKKRSTPRESLVVASEVQGITAFQLYISETQSVQCIVLGRSLIIPEEEVVDGKPGRKRPVVLLLQSKTVGAFPVLPRVTTHTL